MNRPPCTMRMSIRGEKKGVSLWLPLFLVFPIIALFLLALSPLILLLAIVLWPLGWGRLIIKGGPVIYGVLCALRGLEVDVNSIREKVLISFM